MIQPATLGSFEYVRDVRDADRDEMGFIYAEAVVDGSQPANQLSLDADLLLFRGRNSLHRVTPVEDDSTRQLAVLAITTVRNQPVWNRPDDFLRAHERARG